MNLIITAPRGKMASLIVADAAKRDDVRIVAGIGPAGRDYIGKDIGEVAMTGSVVGAPVVAEFAQTGLVPRLPSALLAVALVMSGLLSLVSGLILDTVVKGTRKQYELLVTEAYGKYKK